MRIGFDVDGVIYKFTKAYHAWVNQSHDLNLNLEEEAETWDWFLKWETKEQFAENLHNSVDAGQMYWVGELYEPTIRQNLLDLRAAGHTVHIITARTFGRKRCAEEATRHFFHANGLTYDTLTIAKDKTSVPTDLFLEDNMANYDALEAAGVTAYLVNKPYNQEIGDSRRRVNTVDEFTKLILEEKWQSLRLSYS